MKKGIFIVIAILLIAAILYFVKLIKKNNASTTASTSDIATNPDVGTQPTTFLGKIADIFNIKLPTSTTNTPSNTSGGATNIGSGTSGSGTGSTGSSTPPTTNPNTNTGYGNNSSGNTNTNTVTGPTDPLGFRYKGGQILYAKFNSNTPPAGGYAFLANGTVIYTSGIVYDATAGEYVDVKGTSASSPYNASGVNTNMYLGYFVVSGTWVAVYGVNKYINLSDYPDAFGFLADGAIVFSKLMNEGTPEEYSIYFL